MKAIVGLGNPGPEYRNTRHNIGFAVLDELAGRVVLKDERYHGQALIAEARTRSKSGQPLLLVKPLTYMNRSGLAVAHLMRRENLDPADILVVYDDMDLDLGRVRLRPSGSSGGHRGMQSIIKTLGDQDFARLRCGIGRPGEDEVIDYVLSPFHRDNRKTVDDMVDRAVAAALAFVVDGIEHAMNEYNS